jgi:hypothetical protein
LFPAKADPTEIFKEYFENIVDMTVACATIDHGFNCAATRQAAGN